MSRFRYVPYDKKPNTFNEDSDYPAEQNKYSSPISSYEQSSIRKDAYKQKAELSKEEKKENLKLGYGLIAVFIMLAVISVISYTGTASSIIGLIELIGGILLLRDDKSRFSFIIIAFWAISLILISVFWAWEETVAVSDVVAIVSIVVIGIWLIKHPSKKAR